MIISDGLIRYLQLIHSKDPSGEIYRHDDPVIKRYEILREYARSDFSSRKLNELAKRYEINAKTIKNYLETKRKSGTISLFAEPLISAYNLITADLEKKIVILYRSGETTNKNILKAIRTIDPALKSLGLTGRHINRVLRSHGLIPTQGLENVNFRVLQALLSSFTKLSKKRRRRRLEDFHDPKDQIQQRLEMFRAVYYPQAGADKKSVVSAANTCGISKAQFFNIKKLFVNFGVLGLLSMTRGRITKYKLTPEIEIRIVHRKMDEPNLGPQECRTWVSEELGVKVSRITIDNLFSFWFGPARPYYRSRARNGVERGGREIPHVSTADTTCITSSIEKSKEPISHHYGLNFPRPQVEMLFADIMQWLGQSNDIVISRPGLFILAPYLRRLGIYECFETLVRQDCVSQSAFYAFIININRILGGLCTINRLQFETDLSIPLASGLGAMLSPKTVHKGLEELTADLIHFLKLDVARAARKLGLIKGRKSAFDFHFIIFHGDDADVKGFSKGPTNKGICLPGHRPHIWWDLGANTIGFIYYCQGKERAAKTVLPFLHTCVFEVIEAEMLKEVFMDSEYTGFDIFSYFADAEELNVDVTMCMRSNALRKFISDKIENGPWRPWGEKAKYEICSARVMLQDVKRKVHLVLKRKIGKSKFRIFLTTREDLTDEELLEGYGERWGIENGIKDLVYGYFLDQVPSNSDPVKIDAHFYCVMAAKLAVDLFIKDIGGFVANDRNNSRRTLHSLRDIFFTGKVCRLTRDIDQLILTQLDGIQSAAWDLLMQLQVHQETDQLANAIPWWGGMRETVRYESQLPSNLRGPLKSIELGSPSFLAKELVQKLDR
jgi:hypothetical protein